MRKLIRRYRPGRHRRGDTYQRKAAFVSASWWARSIGQKVDVETMPVPVGDPWCTVPLYVWARDVRVDSASVMVYVVQ
jgi:hypothetical protein